MRDTTALLATLIGRYAASGTVPSPAATLASVGVDALDLPILVLDIEDALNVEIGEEAVNEEMTLAQIARIAAEAKRPTKCHVPISCRPWMERAAA